MTSFNPEQQSSSVESKIVVSLERIAELFRVLLWQESKENSLSPIQIQILLFVAYHKRELCKVGHLATEFNMTKATISDSVKVLLRKELVSKEKDPYDTRSFTLSLTSAGRDIVRKSESFGLPIEKSLSDMSDFQKADLLSSLLEMIHKLSSAGIISVPRMCFSCSYYQKRSEGHFCALLEKPLEVSDLRIDCPEHETK